jgi:hypothetical protein
MVNRITLYRFPCAALIRSFSVLENSFGEGLRSDKSPPEKQKLKATKEKRNRPTIAQTQVHHFLSKWCGLTAVAGTSDTHQRRVHRVLIVFGYSDYSGCCAHSA